MYFLDRDNDSLDTIIFVGIFLVGIITQIIGRLFFNAPAFVVILFLIAYLVGYSVLVYRGTYTKLSRSQAADNFYYMGFLFTITSLAIALYKFGQTTDQSQEDTLKIIVADLGIGLSTTVVGLLLRTVFTQFRNSPEEIEDRVSISLKERAKEVNSSFLGVLRLFESTNTRLQVLTQKTEESLEEVLESFPERVSNIHNALDQSLNESIETFTTKLNNKLNKVDELNLPVEEINAKWANIIRAMDQVDELNELLRKRSEQLSNIDIPTSTIKDSFDSVIQHLKTFEKELTSINIPDNSLTKATDGIVNELKESMSNASEKVSQDLEIAKSNLVSAMQNKEVEIKNIDFAQAPRKSFNPFRKN